jgi:hypothetical protein
MLDLASKKWAAMKHAYGSASNIPAALKNLREGPGPNQCEDEWEIMWGSVHHQGDVYDATYAVVPHLLSIALQSKEPVHWAFFAFPASVEVSRYKKLGPSNEPPLELATAYSSAWKKIPELINVAYLWEWDHLLGQSVAAALLCAKGQFRLADAMLELGPSTINEFFEWYFGVDGS